MKAKQITYTIIEIKTDSDGYSIARLMPGGGYVTDNPYFDSIDGPYVDGLDGKRVGDTITI